jgi:lipoprotein NlpI
MPLDSCRSVCLSACTAFAVALSASVWAQTAPASDPKAKTAPRAPAKAAPSSPRSAPAATGYQLGKPGAWVKPFTASPGEAASLTGGPGYRVLLSDIQTRIDKSGQQMFVRSRTQATDPSGLKYISQPELYFNPAFQTLTVHDAFVLRDGARFDRLSSARIELLRREEKLEQQTLTGEQSLLVVLNDVRVGDVVEVSYTVAGANPIFKGRFSDVYQLSFSPAADLIHVRVEAPPQRPLRVRGLGTEVTPETFVEGGLQVVRIVRRAVPAITAEDHIPPWVRVWPAVHISDYTDWDEVRAWTEDLFSETSELGTDLDARVAAWKAAGLAPEALAARVLTFVQEDVRYFSVSLGESSHRPKAPSRTWAERLGDCKDKVALLNALLRRLGFDAQPALVSIRRNRGIEQMLPSHVAFDHVITRLALDGKVYWLDPTLQYQGEGLVSRGFHDYGLALVAGERGATLTSVKAWPGAAEALDVDQVWDLADLKRVPRLTTTWRARGQIAEAWRGGIAAGNRDRMIEAFSGAYARVYAGTKSLADPVVRDDRARNELEIVLSFEVPRAATFDRGALRLEVPAFEVADALQGPREAKRAWAYYLDVPRQMTQRVQVIGPRASTMRMPPPTEIGDRHFNLGLRSEVHGERTTLTWTYARRSEEVLPENLASYRERVQRARQAASMSMRLPVLDPEGMRPALRNIEERLTRVYGRRDDSLANIVTGAEVRRLFAGEMFRLTGDAGPYAAGALEQRAEAANLLGDYAAALADAERGLRLAPDNPELRYARGFALLGLGRAPEAIDTLQGKFEYPNRAFWLMGLGQAQFYGGRVADAEVSFREAVQEGTGMDRNFALVWLYMSAERNKGAGKAAIEPHLAGVDRTVWSGQLVNFLAERTSQEELLKEARKDQAMERLNLAEAYFFIGQKMMLAGDAAGARRMFQRAVDLEAVPYREHLFAQTELRRLDSR